MRKKAIGVSIVVLIIAVAVVISLNLKDGGVSYTTPAEIKQEVIDSRDQKIGTSVEGRDITTYTFGSGEKQILFVGGIHGGYEWNSTYLAYKLIDYLELNSDFVPEGLKVSIIPSANPDGLFKIVGKEGRFTVNDAPDSVNGVGRTNANNVDLNRNFDCKWKPTSTWRGEVVNAGTEAFSEPEALSIRDVVLETKPEAVIFWHSQANSVYASECEAGVLPETLVIMNLYANASGYTPVESFDSYEITGDAEGWLASVGIPAITVELKTHETIEWEGNLAGIKAILEYYTD